MELAVTSTQIQYKVHFPSLGSAQKNTFYYAGNFTTKYTLVHWN